MPRNGKRKIQECAYCGELKEISREHVIPLCLFSRPYPPNLITVPACDKCNNDKSLDDDYLRDMLTCDIFGNQSSTAQKIFYEKVIKSVNRKSSVIGNTAISNARLEPFYTNQGLYLGEYPSFSIDGERVKNMFSLLIRGLYYDARKERFPDGYVFEILRYYPWDFKDIWEAFSKLNLNGPRALGDVFSCVFASAQEDPFTTSWLILFYERVIISVLAINPKFIKEEPSIIN